MMSRDSFKDKAHKTSASDQESFFNSLSLCEQSIQEEIHKTILNSSCKQNNSDISHESNSDISHENDFNSSQETSRYSQNSNTQDNSDFSDSQFMSLKKFCKCDEILKHLVDNTLRL
jgi:hypothetical protein